jgi:hypothetical protein
VPISSRFSAHQALILPDIRIRSIGEVPSKALMLRFIGVFRCPTVLCHKPSIAWYGTWS